MAAEVVSLVPVGTPLSAGNLQRLRQCASTFLTAMQARLVADDLPMTLPGMLRANGLGCALAPGPIRESFEGPTHEQVLLCNVNTWQARIYAGSVLAFSATLYSSVAEGKLSPAAYHRPHTGSRVVPLDKLPSGLTFLGLPNKT
ncbi:hypothetical protein NEUTE1DRAFT_140365 [Neurospora tetrasperma FGSC 2508]|uniref:Uncharacterized protein n=1 Tax=Neurospora tetrasperma (strain FGSC 2508 / ATCC MYA-4615 / P0657) TaxID=510951 RepID=F8MVW8_NEUT8|nr:uncharacterized protein NEUTE1DRAFT_140365 [Neurospora tetrasperma FGSC 2508]EGO54016.1 hypothetical protein NEUTE1DRAFT_140365 [Neurospora tetrasperma FGSC 2508]EGZ68563.1 hypothetical protein NEUTE2DRAFT_170278 [Neurospora tetrasperma FGSC 2509]